MYKWSNLRSKKLFLIWYLLFRIYDKCESNQTNYINDHKNCYDIPLKYELTRGENYFTISIYEVDEIDNKNPYK